jgi:hypothetical protein
LKALREKKQIMYKGKSLKIAADLSMEILKARRALTEVFQALNENNFSPRVLCPTKLSFKIDGAIKIFHDKQKLQQYMTSNHHDRRFYKEFCTQKMKANKTMRRQKVSNRRKKDKYSESSIDSTAHNQSLTQ